MAELARRLREIDCIFDESKIEDATAHEMFEEYESILYLICQMVHEMVDICMKEVS